MKLGVWGSDIDRFSDWKKGDILAFKVGKSLAGIAEVTGEAFFSEKRIWQTGFYPFRIPIKFTHFLAVEDRPELVGAIREALIREWGKYYGWGILKQILMSGNASKVIADAIFKRPNSLSNCRTNIDKYLSAAKAQV